MGANFKRRKELTELIKLVHITILIKCNYTNYINFLISDMLNNEEYQKLKQRWSRLAFENPSQLFDEIPRFIMMLMTQEIVTRMLDRAASQIVRDKQCEDEFLKDKYTRK